MFVRLLIFTAVIAIMAATVVCGADGQPSNLPDYTLTLDIGLTEPVAADITLNVILNIKGVPATGDVTWQYRKQNTTAWTPVAASSGVASVTFPGANVAQVFELQAIKGGVTTTKMVKVAGKGQLPGDPGTIQPGPITVGSTPPASASMVSFGLPTGPNYTAGTKTVDVTQTPNAAETLLSWNSFLGSPTPVYNTVPTFVGATQVVATGIAASLSDTYTTTFPANSGCQTALNVNNGATTNSMLGFAWNNGKTRADTFYIRTVAAPETRYAYIYFGFLGDAITINSASLTSKIIKADGTTVTATDTQDVASIINFRTSKAYMAKVRYSGGADGVNLEVLFTLNYSHMNWVKTAVGAVIITK